VRLLHLITSVDPRGGGPQEGLRQYCLCAARLGHAFEVATFDSPTDGWVDSFPARVHALGPRRTPYWYAARAIPWLSANVREYGAVVIHGLWAYHVYAGWRALRRSGVPYFVFAHGMLDPWYREHYPLKHLKKMLVWPWAEYRAIRDAARVLFTAEEEARRSSRTFWPWRGKPAVVGFGMGEPPDEPATQAAAFLHRYPALRGKRVLLFLGRLHPVKGCDLAIEAFAAVAGQDARLHLVFGGPDSGGLQPRLAALARSHGIAGRVTWTGLLERDAKWGALRAAEVLLLPSHHENFGVVVAEALACGTPVLISDKVNIWREVIADRAGLVGPDTVEGFARLLSDWLGRSEAERAEIAARGTECYRRQFGIERATSRLLAAMAEAGVRQ
jgi:glycosyltransferase involved in cell wall biosynthesis